MRTTSLCNNKWSEICFFRHFCIWGSPYANFSCAKCAQIPTCESPNANKYCSNTPKMIFLHIWDPRTHNEIVRIWGLTYTCWSPNWNEPHTASGTPRFGILTNPYPNRFGESPFQNGDCFFGVFSVTHKIGLFSPKITSKNREHSLFNYIMNMVHHSIIRPCLLQRLRVE